MVFKGVILEVKDKYSIVMKNDGSIVRVKNKDKLQVGDAILFLEEDVFIKDNVVDINKFRNYKPLATVAACLVIALLFFMKTNPQDPYALLSMDVNPGIQLELDKDKVVQEVMGVNEEGIDILDKELIGLSLDDAMKEIKRIMEESQYLNDTTPILVGFAYLGEHIDERYENEVKDIIKKEYSKNQVLYMRGSSENAKKSIKDKVSLGRLEAENKVSEDKKDTVNDMTVEEILDNIYEKNSENKEIELFNKESDNNSNNNQNNGSNNDSEDNSKDETNNNNSSNDNQNNDNYKDDKDDNDDNEDEVEDTVSNDNNDTDDEENDYQDNDDGESEDDEWEDNSSEESSEDDIDDDSNDKENDEDDSGENTNEDVDNNDKQDESNNDKSNFEYEENESTEQEESSDNNEEDSSKENDYVDSEESDEDSNNNENNSRDNSSLKESNDKNNNSDNSSLNENLDKEDSNVNNDSEVNENSSNNDSLEKNNSNSNSNND